MDLANELDERLLILGVMRLVGGAPVPEVVGGPSGEKRTDGDGVFGQRRQPRRSPRRDRPVLVRIVSIGARFGFVGNTRCGTAFGRRSEIPVTAEKHV